MKYLWLLLYAACLWAFAPALSQAEFTGNWKNNGDYQTFDFGKNFKVLHFQEDIDNRQFIIIDSNRTFYRIGIDSGNIVKSFKLPDIVDLTDADYIKFGAGDSILVINANHDESSKYFCKVIIYNMISSHILFDTTYIKDEAWAQYSEEQSIIVFDKIHPELIHFRNLYHVYFLDKHYSENSQEIFFSYDLQQNTYDTIWHLYWPYVRESKHGLFFSSYVKSYLNSYPSLGSSENIITKYNYVFTDNYTLKLDLSSFLHRVYSSGFLLTDSTTKYYYINHFPGFTADGKYLIAQSDSLIQLFDIDDSTKVIDIPYSSDNNIDIVPIPDFEGNMFYIIEGTDNYLYTRIIKYDYVAKNAIDTSFVRNAIDTNNIPLRIYQEDVRMLDSNIMVGGKYWKLDINDLFANPKIYISIDDTIKTTDKSFNFNSIISSKYNSIRWDFGDGQSSMEPNPVHQYTSAGKYTVTLFVDRGTRIDTLIKHEFVQVFDPPTIKIEYEINTETEPYTITFINKSFGQFEPNTNIIGWFGHSYFDFDLTNNIVQNLTHSGIYTLWLKYKDAANIERQYSEKIEIELPKANIIEWENFCDLGMDSYTNSFIVNNRIYIYGYNYANSSNTVFKISKKGIVNEVANFYSENRITYFDKISENLLCYTENNSSINKFVLCDTNLTTVREYKFNGTATLKISEDSVYVFAQEDNSLNYYKINITNSDTLIEPIKINNSIKSYINFPDSKHIDVFYYTLDSRYRFNFTRFDRSFNVIHSEVIKLEAYYPPVQISNNTYLFYQDTFLIRIKLIEDDIPQIDTVNLHNYFIQNIIRQNSSYSIAFASNYLLNQTYIIMIDNLGEIRKKYLLENNTAMIGNTINNSTENSILLLGYYYDTRNLYIAKTKRLDEDLSDVVEIENGKSEGIIYPNPVEKSLSIRNNNQYPTRIIITNMTGKTVEQNYHIESYDDDILKINVENLLKGAYFIQLNYQNGGINTYKFIKE